MYKMARTSSLAMRRYSIEPRNRILVKRYGFLSFSKSIGKDNHENTNMVNTIQEFLTT